MLFESGESLQTIEIKSGATLVPDWFSPLNKWRGLAADKALTPWLIYGGEENYVREEVQVMDWKSLARS